MPKVYSGLPISYEEVNFRSYNRITPPGAKVPTSNLPKLVSITELSRVQVRPQEGSSDRIFCSGVNKDGVRVNRLTCNQDAERCVSYYQGTMGYSDVSCTGVSSTQQGSDETYLLPQHSLNTQETTQTPVGTPVESNVTIRGEDPKLSGEGAIIVTAIFLSCIGSCVIGFLNGFKGLVWKIRDLE